MKTVLISSFHTVVSRNILSTPIIDHLRSKVGDESLRVIVVCRHHKVPFFKKFFGHLGYEIEGVEYKTSWRDRLMKYCSTASLSTEALRIKRATEMEGSGRLLSFFISNRLSHVLLRFLDTLLTPWEPFEELLGRLKVDVVFSTDALDLRDVRLLQAAKHLSIPAVSMVRSWDNPTSKGLIRCVPDLLIVHNDIVKNEAVTVQHIPLSHIRVTGIPHYDAYKPLPRENFMKRFGLLNKDWKVVLYTPIGDRYVSPNTVDRNVVELLDKILPKETYLFVRFPFTDSVAGLDDRENSGRVIFYRPAGHFETLKNEELSPQDDRILLETLSAADLIVTGPSTIVIDGAFFDKPLVVVNFDGKETWPFLQSVRRYYHYEHWAPIKKSGGARFPKSPEEFKEAVFQYLHNPTLDSEGRKRIVTEQCYVADGGGSERVAKVLFSLL